MGSDLFLLAYDDMTGRLKISEEQLGCGVVAAQLAELMLERRLDMDDGRVVVSDHPGAGDPDSIAAYVVGSIAQQPDTHVVRTWTDNLAAPVRELIARRLVEDGVVRRELRGGTIRQRSERFPALDLLRAARPRVRLLHGLQKPQDLDLATGFMAALLWGLGAERVLEPEVDKTTSRVVVGDLTGYLPRNLAELLRGVESAMAAASVRIRR